jgi:hypothetical protein
VILPMDGLSLGNPFPIDLRALARVICSGGVRQPDLSSPGNVSF